MTEREACIAFNMIPDVGAVKAERLAREAGGSMAEAYSMYPDKRDWEGKEPRWEKEMELASKMGVRLLTLFDKGYPPQLRDLASPPLVLYIVGDHAAVSMQSVAIVGTRSSTPYGRDVAGRFASGLALRGWSVVSGLAMGIDAAAHRAALSAKGVTVGVLGGALDCFYPEINRTLAREMVACGGAVMSEFPFGRKPDPQTFPQRNRIVAALAKGVVAVEAPIRSGTLITCMRALEIGRTVMAVPGRIDWRASAGCHHLIREGARMVTCVDDIIGEITPISMFSAEQSTKSKKAGLPIRKRAPAPPEVTISADEAAILREVTGQGVQIDTVASRTGLDAAKVNSLLVALRLKGRVRFLPGNRVAT